MAKMTSPPFKSDATKVKVSDLPTNLTHPKPTSRSEPDIPSPTNEHTLTIHQACLLYPTSILWAIALSSTILMEGYDQSLVGSLFAYPAFVHKYGTYNPSTHTYQLSSAWMSCLGNAAAFGSIIGLLFNGYVTEKIGHRWTIISNLGAMAGLVFIVFFAPNIGVLFAGQVLLGVTWGGMAVLGSAYASEICPLPLRGHLTAFVNVCWIVGQFVANGLLDGLVGDRTEWGFRVIFAVQWVWILPLVGVAYFAPDSPWWLVRKGKIEDAEGAMRRLSRLSREQIQEKIELIKRTNDYEREVHTGTSFWDCFKGTNLRRTEIASMALSSQTLAGAAFGYNASYFFVQAGLAPSDAYKLQLGGTGLALVCTCLALYLITILGRRTLLISGLALIAIDLLLIGILATSSYRGVLWAQSAFAVIWMGIYSSLIGPESFAMAAEISATRLRAPTLSTARNVYVVVNIINRVIEPYLINPSEANLKGKTAFVWMATSTLTLLWAVFRLPETRGRTYEELDVLFEHRVPAWRFASTDPAALVNLNAPAEIKDEDSLRGSGLTKSGL